jgi:heme exporter protein B
MTHWRNSLNIVVKDVVTEMRTKEALAAMLVFALLVIVIFSFALELRVDNARELAPGILWVTFTFAGTLSFNRSFALERENACIEGLMLALADRSMIYVGKLLGNVVFMSVAEACVLPVFAALFDVPILNPSLWLVILLGTEGLCAVGTLFAAMAVSTRAREVVLPLLLFPIAVPLIIAAVKSTGQILDGQQLSGILVWLRLMLAFDVIFTVLAFLGFEYVIEE